MRRIRTNDRPGSSLGWAAGYPGASSIRRAPRARELEGAVREPGGRGVGAPRAARAVPRAARVAGLRAWGRRRALCRALRCGCGRSSSRSRRSSTRSRPGSLGVPLLPFVLLGDLPCLRARAAGHGARPAARERAGRGRRLDAAGAAHRLWRRHAADTPAWRLAAADAWIVYEVAFAALALFLCVRVVPRRVGVERAPVRRYVRAVLAFVVVYYVLWAASDALIIARHRRGLGASGPPESALLRCLRAVRLLALLRAALRAREASLRARSTHAAR